MTVGIVRIVNFISDTPENDAGMIPVSLDHRPEVCLMVCGKVEIVTLVSRRIDIMTVGPFVLGQFPFIECLVHHEKAEPVAERVKLLHVRVVTHPDRVAAHFSELFQPPVPDFFRGGGAERTAVVMNADALQLHGFSVEAKSVIRVKIRLSHADFDADAGDSGLLRLRDGKDGKLIKIRVRGAPEQGRIKFELLTVFCCLMSRAGNKA